MSKAAAHRFGYSRQECELLIGREVQRFWEEFGERWWDGIITGYDHNKREHQITYDQGTPQETFEWYHVLNPANAHECRLTDKPKAPQLPHKRMHAASTSGRERAGLVPQPRVQATKSSQPAAARRPQQILRDPVTAPECMHSFCADCIDAHIARREKACPSCEAEGKHTILGTLPYRHHKLQFDFMLADVIRKVFPRAEVEGSIEARRLQERTWAAAQQPPNKRARLSPKQLREAAAQAPLRLQNNGSI
ncbi:hypothetical protein WJX72_001400 [[Myrmecia] bisecta]|uniref:Zinc finger C3HC4 RING-type domain-containing protein n=1 Tax=[Myrmecia] bisecta TaxID=41462 RepID=A0AAW1QP11_9CHLO